MNQERVEAIERFLKKGGSSNFSDIHQSFLLCIDDDGDEYEVKVSQLAEDLEEFLFPAEGVSFGEPMTKHCTFCNAKVGELCKGMDGVPVDTFHELRIKSGTGKWVNK